MDSERAAECIVPNTGPTVSRGQFGPTAFGRLRDRFFAYVMRTVSFIISWHTSAICTFKNKVPYLRATFLLSRCGINRQDDRDGHFPASRSFRPSCPLWRKSRRWHSGARPPDFLRQVAIPSPPGFLASGSQIGCGPTVPLQGGRGSLRPGSRRMSFVHERNPAQNLRLVASRLRFVENGRQTIVLTTERTCQTWDPAQ